MPVGVPISSDDYQRLMEGMIALGFEGIPEKEKQVYLKKSGQTLIIKEAGFRFRADNSDNDLVGKVWTSWVPDEAHQRKSDAGWILIANSKGKAKYFTHPFRRTENFVANLLKHAKILKERILRRPRCPECNDFMDIGRRNGKYIGARFWVCAGRDWHAKRQRIFSAWDINMLPESKKFLESERRRRRIYREKRRSEGMPAGHARFKRNKWKKLEIE